MRERYTIPTDVPRGQRPEGVVDIGKGENLPALFKAALATIRRPVSSSTGVAAAPAAGETGVNLSRLTDAELDRLRVREARCLGCDHYVGVCRQQFPQCKPGCQSLDRYRTGWVAWLVEPESDCPLGHWENEQAPPAKMGG